MERVIIVGVGALGSHVALLARNWKNPLRIVDFDRIETKNTQSQFHSKMGLGKNKAQALQQALQGLFGIKIDAVPYKLADDNAGTLLGDSAGTKLGKAALVIDCTDNAAARRVIQKHVRKHGIPCLHGALSADGTFGRIVWDEHFVADEEGKEGQATCEDGEQLPMFALAAAQIAVTAQRFLKDGTKQSFQVMPTGIVRLA
jgi:predicted ThiF/HesA family dinucleotide-utilizing enzyme